MNPPHQLRPARTAASHLRRQDPQQYLRLLEAHLSALIDARDTPDWTINPAYHPDVLAFIQAYSNNSGFMQKAKALQVNRAQYFAKMRAHEQKPTHRPTVLGPGRTTVVQAIPVPMAILVATPVSPPTHGRVLPVARVAGRDKA